MSLTILDARKYILTVIDHFSKYVFAVGLLNKEPNTIIAGFETIFNDQSHIYPTKLITDGGTEFKGEFKDFCATNGIVHVLTMSHSPKQNALIENANKYIRRLMADVFIRTNRLNWIDHLNEILNSRNSTVHNVTKQTPKLIWRSEKQKDLDAQNQEVKTKLDNKVKADITKHKTHELFIGDPVRILLSALHTEVRALIKAGEGKKIIVKYSPQIYKIKDKFIPTGAKRDFQQIRYTLEDEQGYEVWDDNEKAIKFYGSDLQLVHHDTVNTLTSNDGYRLNKLNLVAN